MHLSYPQLTCVAAGFFCGSAANANPQIDSIIFETPVPAAPGAIIPTHIGLITSLRQLYVHRVRASACRATQAVVGCGPAQDTHNKLAFDHH